MNRPASRSIVHPWEQKPRAGSLWFHPDSGQPKEASPGAAPTIWMVMGNRSARLQAQPDSPMLSSCIFLKSKIHRAFQTMLGPMQQTSSKPTLLVEEQGAFCRRELRWPSLSPQCGYNPGTREGLSTEPRGTGKPRKNNTTLLPASTEKKPVQD